MVASLIAQADGSADVERTRRKTVAIEVSSDGLNDVIEEICASSWESGIFPPRRRSRVSRSSVKPDRGSGRLTKNCDTYAGKEGPSNDRKNRKNRERQHRK